MLQILTVFFVQALSYSVLLDKTMSENNNTQRYLSLFTPMTIKFNKSIEYIVYISSRYYIYELHINNLSIYSQRIYINLSRKGDPKDIKISTYFIKSPNIISFEYNDLNIEGEYILAINTNGNEEIDFKLELQAYECSEHNCNHDINSKNICNKDNRTCTCDSEFQGDYCNTNQHRLIADNTIERKINYRNTIILMIEPYEGIEKFGSRSIIIRNLDHIDNCLITMTSHVKLYNEKYTYFRFYTVYSSYYGIPIYNHIDKPWLVNITSTCFDTTTLEIILHDDICPSNCFNQGICNERTKKCECMDFYGNIDCSVIVLPLLEDEKQLYKLDPDRTLYLKQTDKITHYDFIRIHASSIDTEEYSYAYISYDTVALKLQDSTYTLRIEGNETSVDVPISKEKINSVQYVTGMLVSAVNCRMWYSTHYLCTNTCSGNGVCSLETGRCICNRFYFGFDCSYYIFSIEYIIIGILLLSCIWIYIIMKKRNKYRLLPPVVDV